MIRLGNFAFDPASGELTSSERHVRLTPQTAQVLVALLEAKGGVVSRGELRERIWPDSTVEFDQGLAFCIRQLRVALGDDASNPTYIETLPRRGFRLIAPIQDSADAAPEAVPRKDIGGFRRRIALSCVVLLAVATAGWMWHARAADGSVTIAIVPFDADSTIAGLADYRDHLAEAAVTRATQRGGSALRVLGPSTTKGFHSRTLIDSIARATGARYALSGVVRPWNGGIRVFSQLIRASDRAHVWVDRWLDSSSQRDAGAVGTRIADSVVWVVTHPNERRPLPK